MSRKLNIILSIGLVLGFVLSACGTAAAPTTAAGPTTAVEPTVAGAEQPTTAAGPTTAVEPTTMAQPAVSDKVLVNTPGGQSLTTFTKNFNPFGSKYLSPTRFGIYESLMIYNRIKSELVPWLATDYKWSDDNLTLTFTLRDGVKWSDGEPFTAADVAYTFNLLKSNNALSGAGQNAIKEGGFVSEVKANSDGTVDFVFNKVYVPGIYEIISQVIVPEHIWSTIADPVAETNPNPVGSGPFTEVVEFKDQVYEVDRNPNYWQEGKPAFKGLRFPAYSGNDTAENMLITGDVDWTGQFFSDLPALYSKNPDVQCWWPTVSASIIFMTNTTRMPFDDVVVRKAIGLSFDHAKLIDIALQGQSKPGDLTSLTDGFAAYKADVASLGEDWVGYDAAKANQMLDQAGYAKGADGYRTKKDGSAMQLELIMVNGFSDWLAVAPLLKQELNDIGLNVVINNYDSAVAYDKWFKGDFDMSLTFFDLGTPTLYSHFRNMLSASTLKPIGEASSFGINLWRFSDPAVDPWIEKLASSMDPTTMKESALELQKIFAADAPVIPMWSQPLFNCYSNKNFSGWPTPDNPYSVAFPSGPGTSMEDLIVWTTLQGK